MCDGFKTLFQGQKISFELGTNKHGEPKAIEVVVISQK
jgi:cold shock CspA family protein